MSVPCNGRGRPRLDGRARAWRVLPIVLIALGIAACGQPATAVGPRALPAPLVDAAPAPRETLQEAVFAGGCYWGIQAVFEHVRGVAQVDAGYAGGQAATAHYDQVSTGVTGHAESVRVRYDPAQVSYGTLLRIFFSVALDPTERNRQGPDVGSQYRSILFYADAEQERIAKAYLAQLTRAHAFDAPIVTGVAPLAAFCPAEDYLQDYYRKHPDSLYVIVYDKPKVAHLRQVFPALYREDRQYVAVEFY